MKKLLTALTLVGSSVVASHADSLSTAYQCQSAGGLETPSIRAEVLLPPDYVNRELSQGIVLLQHWSLNPEGNHAFAPDMIFLKDYYDATVKNTGRTLEITDPSGASLTIDGQQGTLVFLGNRNVRRSFEVTEAMSLDCTRKHTGFEVSQQFSELYRD